MTSSNPIDLPFAILPIEGKGQGAIAKRLVNRGELILAEPPLLVQGRHRTSATIRLALSQLSGTQQREYLSLANCHCGTMDPFLGTFVTNCLPLGDNSALSGEHASQAGIFLIACRFNSSCVPNVNHYYDEDCGLERLYAMRDILEGEELCISYAELFQPRDTRRKILERNFKFLCTCRACSLGGKSLQESNARRMEIRELYAEICIGGDVRPRLLKVKRALELLKLEGLYHYQESFYYDGFQCCVMVSDFQNARSWIQCAHSAGVISSGSQYDKLKRFQALAKRPDSHSATGLYPKARLFGPPPME